MSGGDSGICPVLGSCFMSGEVSKRAPLVGVHLWYRENIFYSNDLCRFCCFLLYGCVLLWKRPARDPMSVTWLIINLLSI